MICFKIRYLAEVSEDNGFLKQIFVLFFLHYLTTVKWFENVLQNCAQGFSVFVLT
jgi:hypothetical protein